ncbi:hypothetical protein Poli38472_003104 [Pythium oligandrum]|uniref:DUF2723 domain-containing protein n=1 Tax=Pythium oligandrum TaxID=41045 RepID=A0A8K1FDR2_PYTOL|nr:hypothetical protein Poli38472_003104 [Pythium oligandrum]|eukprot:TMW57179.1 hypothetical protein Poli38472_003104 [Pythium oligandrum]
MMDKPQGTWGVAAWLWTLGIAWTVYASSSIGRLAGGDSGELLAEACVGGVAHPPGYPLLLLLLRVVKWIGERVTPHMPFVVLANHLNAVFMASAAACVTHSVDLVTNRKFPGESVVAGLLFAFSKLTWEYAIGLEVFALNNLLIGLLHIQFIKFVMSSSSTSARRYSYSGAFLCGLGLTNQHTIVLFEIPMVLVVLLTRRIKFRELCGLGLVFLIGVSIYSYTYHAAQTPTPGSWGDASTLFGLLTHIFRREYGTFRLSPITGTFEGLWRRLAYYAHDIVDEFSLLGIALAVFGLIPVFSKKAAHVSTIGRTQLAMIVVYLLVFNSLANLPLDSPLPREVTRRFFLQPNMIIATGSGLGMVTLQQLLQAHYGFQWTTHGVRVLFVMMATTLFSRHRPIFTTDLVAELDLIRSLGTSVLASLPANAVLLSYTDIQWNAVRYLQACEAQRPDVTHLNLQIMAFPWFKRQHPLYDSVIFPAVRSDVSTNRSSQAYAHFLGRFLHANLPRHAIFLDLHAVDEASITSDQVLYGFQVLPHGFVWHAAQETRSISPQKIRQAWKAQATAIDMPPSLTPLAELLVTTGIDRMKLVPSGSWEFVVLSIAVDAVYQRNLARLGYLLSHGSVKTVGELEKQVLLYHSIQQELWEIVMRVTAEAHMLTYEQYVVKKNAVVSLQRFQLYLDVLSDLAASQQAPPLSKYSQHLLEQSWYHRHVTIERVSGFLTETNAANDPDASSIRSGLETIEARMNKQPIEVKKKKKTKKKPQPKQRNKSAK